MSVLLSGIIQQNDLLFYFINRGMDNSFLDFLMPFLTNFGSIVAWGIVCGLLFIFGGENGKKIALLGLAALFAANVTVYLLKYLIAEPRPFLVLPNVDLLVSENEIYSFPSGHSASSFAAAVIIGLKYKINYRGKSYRLIYPLLAFASLIAFSRVYIGVHYPLDVVFGAIVGILSALLILKIGDHYLVDKISHVCLKDKLLSNIPKINKD